MVCRECAIARGAVKEQLQTTKRALKKQKSEIHKKIKQMLPPTPPGQAKRTIFARDFVSHYKPRVEDGKKFEELCATFHVIQKLMDDIPKVSHYF